MMSRCYCKRVNVSRRNTKKHLLVKHNDVLMLGVLLCQAQGEIIGL